MSYLLCILFFREDSYLFLSACHVLAYFYSIWFHFHKIQYGITGFLILEMRVWSWGMTSRLLFSQ